MFEKAIFVKRHLMYKFGNPEVEHSISWQNNYGLLEAGPCAVIEKDFRGEMFLDRLSEGQWAQIPYASENGVVIKRKVEEDVVFTTIKFKNQVSDVGFCDPKEANIVVKQYTTTLKTIYEIRNKSSKVFPDLLITHVKRSGFKISPFQSPKAMHTKSVSESTFLAAVPLPGEKPQFFIVLELQKHSSNTGIDEVLDLNKEEYNDWADNHILAEPQLRTLIERHDKKRQIQTLQNLLVNSFAHYDVSLPDPIEEKIKTLTNLRRNIKRINEVMYETNTLIKKKMRNSKRIFENLKSLQSGNNFSEKLQEELNLTIMSIEKEISKLMAENTNNKKVLKNNRKEVMEVGKACRKLIRDELTKFGKSVDDTSDESDDFGPDPILEEYERRIRKVFKRNHEQDRVKIKSTLQKLRFKFASNPKQLYVKVCRSYGEDFDEEYGDEESSDFGE